MKAFIFGIGGKMGHMLVETAASANVEISGGFDRLPHDTIRTFNDVENVNVPCDVIIDFSRPELLDSVISLAERLSVPAVLATTGYDAQAVKKIEALSRKVPVLRSGNMSVGVNMILELVERAAKALCGFDIEIVEKHHNQKADAPSGTALMLADAAAKARGGTQLTYGRQGLAKRTANEIGIHAVRGGTIVGEHEVLFCGRNETVTISHTALSRNIFAEGAFRAAAFLINAKPGLYSMKDVL